MSLTWLSRAKPCKIGTMPMLVHVHAGDYKRMAPGKYARVRYAEGGRWERVLVTRVDQDGYFMANK
jgi:hypothetical protein